MKVLVSAFAFSPYRGSECAVGWNVVNALSRMHEITVLCGDVDGSLQTKRDLERYYGSAGRIGLNGGSVVWQSSASLRVVYVPPDGWITALERLHRIPGLWALYYLAYNAWQKKAFCAVKALLEREHFDLVHQLTMIGFREPGYLWKVGVPFVWGPVGGGPNEPFGFLSLFSVRGRIQVLLRTLANEVQKRICTRARGAAKAARQLWMVTDEDAKMAGCIWKVGFDRLIEAGTDPALAGMVREFKNDECLRIVWSGIHTPRKALPILLYALRRLRDMNVAIGAVRVDVLGEGVETENWRRLSRRLAVDGLIEWHGRVPREEALQIMRKAHVLVCTSVKEASSIVVIEAVSLGLPVICHDACGMGVVITEEAGIKIPMVDAETSEVGFAAALQDVLENRHLIRRLSEGALKRAQALTWEAKADIISQGYGRVCE